MTDTFVDEEYGGGFPTYNPPLDANGKRIVETTVIDHRLAPDDVRPVEDRAQVDSLGDLHQRRRELLKTLAPLKALHGHNGIFDDRRKQLLEALKVRHRMGLTQGGAKATDSAVEAAAYADEQYERFLDTGYADRIEYINLANELSEIEERIKSREIELLVYNSEVKLDR